MRNTTKALVVVLFDNSLRRLLDNKGFLQILQVAIDVIGSINFICCKSLLPFDEKAGKKLHFSNTLRWTEKLLS